MGKGDTYRKVDRKKYEENYQRIFGEKKYMKYYIIYDNETDEYWTDDVELGDLGWSEVYNEAKRYTQEERTKLEQDGNTKLAPYEEWMEVNE